MRRPKEGTWKLIFWPQPPQGLNWPRDETTIGLFLAAALLSLAALFFVVTAVFMVFAGVFTDHHPFVAASPTVTPHFFLYLMLAVAVFYAALATWATLTVIGILRLRSWARYSILIIGGLSAVFSLVVGVGTIASRTLLEA